MNQHIDRESSSAANRAPPEVQRLLAQLQALQQQGLPPRDYLNEFLQHTLSALSAVGGAIWSFTSLGASPECVHGMRITGLDDEEYDRQRHVELLLKVLDDGDAVIVPPRSDDAADDFETDGNPSLYWLLIAPLRGPGGMGLVVEAYLRQGGAPSVGQDHLQVLKLAVEQGSRCLNRWPAHSIRDQAATASTVDQFAQAAHGSLDLRETAASIAHEARRLLNVDRVTVTATRRGRQRVVAISNQETFDARASSLQLLEKIAATVAAGSEPMWHSGANAEPAPQIQEVWQQYQEQSHSQAAVVVCLFRPQMRPTEDSREIPEVIGAIVVESFQAALAVEELLAPLASIVPHCAAAVAHAQTYEQLFLLPVWRFLGRSRALVGARHGPKTAAVAAAVCLALMILTFVPQDFALEGRGTLLPAQRREVFAEVDGEVVRVHVQHGQAVQQGDVLCELKNVELEVQSAGVEGQINSTLKKLRATEQALLADGRLNGQERSRLHGERVQARQELQSLKEQSALLEHKRQQLQVHSPITGQVVTWSAQETLTHRPVKRGDLLLSVVDPTQEWELEVRMPEDRMGHVAAAQEQIQAELPVRFILATQPGRTLHGVVQEVHERAEVRGDEGNTVLVRVKLDSSQLVAPRPGAEVTARIACGRRSLGYVWLHDVWAFIESRILFRL